MRTNNFGNLSIDKIMRTVISSVPHPPHLSGSLDPRLRTTAVDHSRPKRLKKGYESLEILRERHTVFTDTTLIAGSN